MGLVCLKRLHTALWWPCEKWHECCRAPWLRQLKEPTLTLATVTVLLLEQTQFCKIQCFGGAF